MLTGWTQPSDRYFASLHVRDAPDIPAKNWNDQKAVLTGYTQPGDKYFATRQRLAYHPRDKTFASPGLGPTTSSKQTAPPPKPAETAPPPPPPPPQKSAKEQSLEDYEKGYLERYAKEKEERAKQAEAKKQSQTSAASKKGAMPKGF